MISNRYRVGCVPMNKGMGRGFISEAGYRRVKVDGRDVMEHRLVWEAKHGPISENAMIHHINGTRLDNQLENLTTMRPGDHTRLHAPHLHRRPPGWHHSEETKEKIRQSNIRTKRARRP